MKIFPLGSWLVSALVPFPKGAELKNSSSDFNLTQTNPFCSTSGKLLQHTKPIPTKATLSEIMCAFYNMILRTLVNKKKSKKSAIVYKIVVVALSL
jgi:hypothetical protein